MGRWFWIVAVALVLAAWVASGALYSGLPEEIPRHWDIHGKLNGYGPRWTVFLLPTTMLFMLLLFAFLPTLSPKNFEVDSFRSTYLFILVLTTGLLGSMHGLILYAAMNRPVDIGRAIFGGLFLFFALIGSVLGRVRRNFYIGVRVPWTLASEPAGLGRHSPPGVLAVRDHRADRVRHRGGRRAGARFARPAARRGGRTDCLLVRALQAARTAWGLVVDDREKEWGHLSETWRARSCVRLPCLRPDGTAGGGVRSSDPVYPPARNWRPKTDPCHPDASNPMTRCRPR